MLVEFEMKLQAKINIFEIGTIERRLIIETGGQIETLKDRGEQ